MDKKKALNLITSCSYDYHNNLENKNLMLIYGSSNRTNFIEVNFFPRNFLHLTGIKLNSKISSKFFYKKCLNGKLEINEFELLENGYTELKLSVLPTFMQIHNFAYIIDNNKFNPILITHKTLNNVTGRMGLILDNSKFYVPNTNLIEYKSDATSKPTHRIIAIFKKNIGDEFYNDLCYTAKGIDKDNLILSKEIHNKINI